MVAIKRRHITRLWAWILLFIIIIGVICFTGPLFLNRIIQNTIKEKLSQLSPVATVSYSAIKANFFAATLSISDLTIQLQPNRYDSIHHHQLRFSTCAITGISFLQAVLHKKLSIQKLQLNNGEIRLDPALFDSTHLLQKELSARMPFKNISINQVQLAAGSIWLTANGENKLLGNVKVDLDRIRATTDSFQLGAVQCTAQDINYALPDTTHSLHIHQFILDSKQQIIQIDSVKIYAEKNELAFLTAIKISAIDVLKGFNNNFIDGKMTIDGIRINSLPNRSLHIKKLIADSRNTSLRIESLSIGTKYAKYEFGKKLGRQADYIEAEVPAIEVSHLNFKALLNKKLVADKVTLTNSSIYFFRDRRLPLQQKKQPLPNDYLQQIPISVRLNTFTIQNASIISEEHPRDGEHTGYLKIAHATIAMSPVINHPGKQDPGYSNTEVAGSIMDAGLISATIHAPLRKNIYQVKGVIKNLDLVKLNPSAENLGQFHIESGILNTLDFQFKATEEKATGQIIGEYHDLKIDRLKQKGEKRVAKIPTFFLKHVIIPKDKDKSLKVKKRTGKIDYLRDLIRMVSFYFLKSLLDGIRSSFTLGFLLPQ
jgi:hypothetical protein